MYVRFRFHAEKKLGYVGRQFILFYVIILAP